MSFLLSCPYCGPRPVDEYAYFGEVTKRPSGSPSLRDLTDYVYFRDNVAGVQREWWQHRTGCGEWFLAERDTRTNEVLEVMHPRARGSRREARSASRRADRPLEGGLVHLRGLEDHRLRGRHDRVGRVRRGQARLLALLQVPPAARPPLLLGPLPELPDDRRRRAERARLHRADPRGRRRRGAERPLVARLRLHVRDGQARRPVHAGRLLLPHVHPPARRLAAVREVPAQRGRAREARPARGSHPPLRHGAPPRARARRRRRRGRSRGSARGGEGRARESSSSTRTRGTPGCRSTASRCSRRHARSGSGRAVSFRSMPTRPSIASARSGSSSRRARPSSRSSSRATTSSA